MNDDLCPDRRSQSRSLHGYRRHGVIREYSLRRGDDLELGLTKDEVIIICRRHRINGDTFLSSLHRTDAPSGLRG